MKWVTVDAKPLRFVDEQPRDGESQGPDSGTARSMEIRTDAKRGRVRYNLDISEILIILCGQSQRPRGLRHQLSWHARTLRSHGCLCAFILCVGSDGLIPRPRSPSHR
jgi:hypothetical protein